MRRGPLPGRLRALVAVGLAMSIVLASCAGGPRATTATRAAGDVLVVAPQVDPPTAPAVTVPVLPPIPRLESRDDLVSESRAIPEEVSVDPADANLLHVTFAGGVPPCFGARIAVARGAGDCARPAVHRRPARRRDGHLPGRRRDPRTAVVLDHPLGTREILWS